MIILIIYIIGTSQISTAIDFSPDPIYYYDFNMRYLDPNHEELFISQIHANYPNISLYETIQNKIYNGISIIIENEDSVIISNNSILNVDSNESPYGIAIINSSNIIIRENLIENITNTKYRNEPIWNKPIAIFIIESENITIDNNIINTVEFDLDDYGIYFENSRNIKIVCNSIINIAAGTWNAIAIRGVNDEIGQNDNLFIADNVITDIKSNDFAIGINLIKITNVTISNNEFLNFDAKIHYRIGIMLDNTDEIRIENNSFLDILKWIKSVSSTNIYCNNNIVDGEIMDACEVPIGTTTITYFPSIEICLLLLVIYRRKFYYKS